MRKYMLRKFILLPFALVLMALVLLVRGDEAVETPSAGKPKCSGRCFRNYRPVCGSNGRESRTFPNQCVLNYHNCLNPDTAFTDQRPGACPREEVGDTQQQQHQSSEETS
ncbi:vasotab-like [Ischnura elegans]|uniref:vasotab-like n=1 Tax=Ischnura elegans TaxID=197161 RepID=UPI001ED892F7|nr:vasotab-like [Ischnura elegans]